MRRTIGATLFLAALVTRQLAAQAVPDSVHHRNDCRLAMQIIRDGHPANRVEWAQNLGPSCGVDFAAAVADRFKTQRQAAYADDLGRLADRTWTIRDGVLLDAVLEVAADPAASLDARLLALRTAAWQVSNGPAIGQFSDFKSGTPYTGWFSCLGASVTDVELVHGVPVTRAQVERAVAIGNSISGDASAPPDVRRMGACLASRAEYKLKHP